MIIHSAEHKFVYIDPVHKLDDKVEGDGSTPSSPLHNFPASLANNTIYVVRRSTRLAIAEVQNGSGNNSINSLVIWGMPHMSDPRYEKMPTVAKTAWGNDDVAGRAYVQFKTASQNGHCLHLSNCENIDLYNFAFMSDHDSSSDKCCIRAYSQYGTNINCEKVWFRCVQDWVNTNTPPSNRYVTSRWIRLNNDSSTEWGWAHSAIFKNCTLDFVSCYSGINFGYGTENIIISDCKINIHQGYSGSNVFEWKNYGSKAPNVSLINIDAKYHYSTRYEQWMARTFFGWTHNCNAYNLSYTKASTQRWTPRDNAVFFEPFVYLYVYSAGAIFEKIKIEYPDIIGMGAQGFRIEKHETDPTFSDDGQYIRIIDFTATCGDTIKYNDHYNSNADNPNHFDDQNRYILSLYGTSSNRNIKPAQDFLLQNINIRAIRGRAVYARRAFIDLKDKTIVGGVRLDGCMGKIKGIETWYVSRALQDDGQNTLYIGTITCNRRDSYSEYTGQPAIRVSWRSDILVSNCNTKLLDNGTSDENRHCSYICTNDGLTGNYTVRSSEGFCQTWSTNRVGSVGGCTLKLSNEIRNNNAHPLRIGGAPFKGITKNVTAGKHVATIYANTYGYNTPEDIKNKLRCKLTFKDESFITSYNGNWSPDTVSTWENIDGGTAFKLEIPFEVAEAQDVEFSFDFSWYMVGGAVYLDPHPIIS